MAIRAFLLCGDEKAVQAVTQILDELEISFEHSSEPAFSLKRLSTQRFELLVVDCDDAQNATQVFNSARASNLNKTSIAIAIVEGKAGVPNAFRLGASLVLTKPVSLEQARNTLRTGIGMARKDAPEVKPTTPIATPLVTAPAVPSQTIPAAPAPRRPTPSVLTPVAPVAPTASATTTKVVVPTATVAEKPVVVSRPVVGTQAAAAQDPKAGPTAPTDSKPQSSVVVTPVAGKTAAASSVSTPAAKSSFDSMFTTPAEPEKDSGKNSAKSPADEKDSNDSPRLLSVVDPLAEEESVDPLDEQGVPSFGGLGKQPFAGMEKPKRSGGHGVWIAAGLVLVLAGGAYGAWMTQPSFRNLVSWEYLSLMSKVAGTHAPQPTPVAARPVASPPAAVAQTPPQPAAGNASPSDPAAAAPTQTAPAASADASAVSNASASSAPPAAATVDSAQKSAAVQPAKQDTTPKHQGANPALVSASASLPSSDTVKPPSSDLLEVPEDYADDQVVHRVHPVYPKQAKARKLQGPVVLEAVVNKHGKVDSLQLVSGDPVLAQAAADAVKQWRYKPYSHNGEPADFQTRVTVDFKLP